MTDSDKNGIGMINLQSRVETLNDDFAINSIDHKGTTIYVEFDISKCIDSSNGKLMANQENQYFLNPKIDHH